jgi:3-oxoacid CoA-transferase subunit A
MNKVFSGALVAMHDVDSNVTIMLRGFGLCGIPEDSIAA